MAWIGAVVSGVISLFGGQDSSRKVKRHGRDVQRARNLEAKQLEEQALREIGIGQIKGLEEAKRAEIVASRALAVAAAGGGASDPTVMNIIADIEGEGAYHQAVELYNGEEQARVLREQARVSRQEGRMAARGAQIESRAYQWQAAGSMAQSYSSLYSKYGKKTGTPGSGVDFSGYQSHE